MAYMKTTSKYSALQNQRWSVAAMVVLSDSQEAMTCDEIRRSDLSLVEVTPQKLSRLLSEMVEAGFVAKTKGRDGRMRYKSVGVLREQGYDVERMVY